MGRLAGVLIGFQSDDYWLHYRLDARLPDEALKNVGNGRLAPLVGRWQPTGRFRLLAGPRVYGRSAPRGDPVARPRSPGATRISRRTTSGSSSPGRCPASFDPPEAGQGGERPNSRHPDFQTWA